MKRIIEDGNGEFWIQKGRKDAYDGYLWVHAHGPYSSANIAKSELEEIKRRSEYEKNALLVVRVVQ